LEGDVTLQVNDVDAFVTSAEVKAAVQEGIATSVGVAKDKVVIESITQVVRRLSGEERRLAAGSVKAKYKITDDAKKIEPASLPALATKVKDTTNAALKKAGKTEAVTVATTPPPTKTSVPKTKATTTTAKPTTTTFPVATIIETTIDLEVTDKAVFQSDINVVTALKEAIASLLAMDEKNVEILSITGTNADPVAVKSRRLDGKNEKGKVQAKVKITDPKNKLTPAKVQGIAPKLPAAVNPKLAAKKVPAKVGKAAIAAPTLTKTVDPCKPVVPVAPVAPVAPANPCAPVVPAPVAPVAPVPPVVPPIGGRRLQEIVV
jgi:hypothetical protein